MPRKSVLPFLTLASGAVIVASFPPWDFRFLIFISLTPWLLCLRLAPDWKTAVRYGVFLSMVMSGLGFYWVGYVLHEFGQLPWVLAGLGLFLFSTFGQPQFTFFAPIYWRLTRERSQAPTASAKLAWGFAIALLYAGMDWAIPKLFHDTLGHSQYSAPWLRQSADLWGAHGLSFVIFWINDSLVELACAVKQRKEPSLWPSLKTCVPSLALSLIVLMGVALYGKSRNEMIQALTAHPAKSVRAAVIQANIGDIDKIAAHRGLHRASEIVMERYFTVSDRALSANPRPDFLVWPETAYPSTFRTPMTADDLTRDERVESFVKDRKFPLLFGGYDHTGEGNFAKDYNAFFALSPAASSPSTLKGSGKGDLTESGETELSVYRKNILLLFGEYVPFTEDSLLFRKYFPQVGNFGRGVGPDVLKVPLPTNPQAGFVKLSPVICYEALFPNYVISAANQGSELIMNITNDSWFGPYGEPELHLALSTFRSIETRLPQLRATNTGVSALILADGTISARTQTFVEDVLAVPIPLTKPIWTLMRQWGDWFGYGALIVSWGLIALLTRRSLFNLRFRRNR